MQELLVFVNDLQLWPHECVKFQMHTFNNEEIPTCSQNFNQGFLSQI